MNAPTPRPTPVRPDVADILGDASREASGRRRRKIAIFAVAVLLAAGGSWLWLGGDTTERITYDTGQVTRGQLVVTVTATGSLQPINQVEVSSELSGTVGEVLADYNMTVTKGEVLAELDTDTLEMAVQGARAKLMAAEAGVEEAKATIAEAKSELDRKTALVARNVATSQELEAAKAQNARAVAAQSSAEAAVEVAKADLALAETNLAKACICSPIDGIVLSRDVEPGQTVAASLQAPTLFTIAEDLRRMELRVDVDEADVGSVREGQSAAFTVDAYPGREFPAVIRTVRFASETVQGVVTYKAILDVANADLALRPGMTATADIVVEREDDQLLVPNQALRWAPDAPASTETTGSFISRLLPRPPSDRVTAPVTDGKTVYVLREGTPTAVPVDVGATDGQHTAVSGDLGEGDVVVLDSNGAG